MLVDANLLLFAVDESSRFHHAAHSWLTAQMNGPSRVGLPWLSLGAFVRITTHPRALPQPLAPEDAWSYVRDWLAADVTWIPGPTDRHEDVLGRLIATHQPRGNLATDAQVAALAVEHGLTICSADTDFARFTEARWVNPLA